MQTGIYSTPFEQYSAVPAASKHLLDSLSISPLHCWAYNINPERGKQKATPARVLGNAIHVSILEPERFEKEFVREPDIANHPNVLNVLEDYKKACKEAGLKITGTKPELKKSLMAVGYQSVAFWDDLYKSIVGDRIVLSESDWRVTKAITSRVRKHPNASELLKHGKAEQSIFWVDKETGVQCKGRLDWLAPETPKDDCCFAILDLKSTTDASPEGFQRSISKYRYYVQAAMYIDGAQAIGCNPQAFIFAAWEKHSPYASALYYATPEMLEAGRTEYRRLLKIYAKCLESDTWPGYSTDVMPISMPEHYKASPLSELEESDWLEQMEESV